jgi:hypothetical protein
MPVEKPTEQPKFRPAPISTFGAIYLVKSPYYGDPWNGEGPAYDDGSGYVIAAYAHRAAAERHRAELALKWRKEWLTNPLFRLSEVTSYPPALLRDWVLDLGLDAPTLEECHVDEAWQAWWERIAPQMTDGQRERFLAAMDRADGGYWVQEVPLGE